MNHCPGSLFQHWNPLEYSLSRVSSALESPLLHLPLGIKMLTKMDLDLQRLCASRSHKDFGCLNPTTTFPCTSVSYRWAGIKTPPPPRPGMQAQHGRWPLLWPPMRPSLAQQSDVGVFLRVFGCLSFSGLLVSHLLTPHTTVAQPQDGFQLQAAAFVVTVPQPSFWSPVRQDHYWTFPWLKTRTLFSSSSRAGVLSLKYRFSREQRPHHLIPILNCCKKRKNSPYLLNAHAKPCIRLCSISGWGSHMHWL